MDTAKVVGRSVWTTGVFDIAVSEILTRLISPGDFVLDVGANIGYMSVVMGLAAAEKGELLSFEPHPALFGTLETNIEHVRKSVPFARVELRNKALSVRAGEARLTIPHGFDKNDGIARLEEGGGSPEAGIAVETETLDGIMGRRTASVMKLDVEGHELAVIKGGGETLRRGAIRHIVFEDHQGPESPVSSLLRNHRYALFQIGWRIFGPRLEPTEARRICSSYEAPSYLATLDPENALAVCRARGWNMLASHPPGRV
ncbi:MAG: FkbM family methyltransferase [Acidobacteria bacterium]|nr:FkbM family methyltransferase [Acidobacteriota bacterium]